MGKETIQLYTTRDIEAAQASCVPLERLRHKCHSERECAAVSMQHRPRLVLPPLTATSPPSYTQGLTAQTESNGAVSPAPPSRASPSPPTTANGSSAVDRDTSMANEQAAIPQTITAKNPKLAAQMANDLNIVRRKLTGYVGFANLPNQWHRKSVRKGFNFNVMVVGMCAPGHWAISSTLTIRQVNLALESRHL